MEQLRKSFASGKITKDKINKRGYNKFLKIENDVAVAINEDKIAEDALWDGLKGYVTNTALKIAKTISTIQLKLPLNDKIITRTMLLTPEHHSLQPLLTYLGV